MSATFHLQHTELTSLKHVQKEAPSQPALCVQHRKLQLPRAAPAACGGLAGGAWQRWAVTLRGGVLTELEAISMSKSNRQNKTKENPRS